MGWTGRSIVGLALLIILGSFLAPVAYVVHLAGRASTVEREIERIRRAGGPVSVDDLRGEPVPDDRNAAVLYAKCFGVFPRSGAYGRRFFVRGFTRFDVDSNDARQWADARGYVNRYKSVLKTAEEAAAMPVCRFPVEKTVSFMGQPHHRGMRQLVRLVVIQALLNAKDGRTDLATKHIGLSYRMAEGLAGEQSLLGQSVRLLALRSASDALAQSASLTRFSESQARELSETIARVDIDNSLRRGLEGERVRGIALYRSVSRGTMPIMDTEHSGTGRAFKRLCSSLPGRTWLYTDQLYYLAQMKRCLEAAGMPSRKVMAMRLDHRARPPRYALFSTLLLPHMEQLTRDVDLSKSSLAGSRVFLGLLAYRDRFGEYPAALADLRNGLDWPVPVDPYSGKAFIYRRQGSGFILYSSGDDRNAGTSPSPRNAPEDLVWSLKN